MSLSSMTKADVQDILRLLRARVSARDADVMAALGSSDAAKASTVEQVHTSISADLDGAIAFVNAEDYHSGEDFHSRNRLAGLAQANLNEANPSTHNPVGDALVLGRLFVRAVQHHHIEGDVFHRPYLKSELLFDRLTEQWVFLGHIR